MDALGVIPGDKVRLNKAELLSDLYRGIVTADGNDDVRREQTERVERRFNDASAFFTVVGHYSSSGGQNTVFVPVASGLSPVYTQAAVFGGNPVNYTDELTFDFVECVLASTEQAEEFSEFAKKKVAASIGGMGAAGFNFVMDMSEAANMQRTLTLLDGLYPIAVAAALILGGLFPGLIVMQSDREAAVMRVLGTTRKRTRSVLVLHQVILCAAGLACAVLLLLIINGLLLLMAGKSLASYAGAHLIACAAGALTFAVVLTRRRILEMLQVKE